MLERSVESVLKRRVWLEHRGPESPFSICEPLGTSLNFLEPQ